MTNGLKLLAESLIICKIQYTVINYINLFVFDDEIGMKNRSTIQTLTFVQTNPDHLYMKLVVVHAIIHSFGSKKLASCKNCSWLLTFKAGTWKWHLAIFLAPTFWEPEQPLWMHIIKNCKCPCAFQRILKWQHLHYYIYSQNFPKHCAWLCPFPIAPILIVIEYVYNFLESKWITFNEKQLQNA